MMNINQVDKRKLYFSVILILAASIVIICGLYLVIDENNKITYGDILSLQKPPGSSITWKEDGEVLRIDYGKKIKTSETFQINKLKNRREKLEKAAPAEIRTEIINRKKYTIFEPESPHSYGLFFIYCYPEGIDIEIWGSGNMVNYERFYDILKSIEWINGRKK